MFDLDRTPPQPSKLGANPNTFQLDVGQNRVLLADGVHVFNRRWEVAALGLLLDAAKSGAQVTQAELQAHLMRLGQLKLLTRAQLLRIVDNLKQFCLQNDLLGFQLHHAPRRASTGPWFVLLGRVVEWRRLSANSCLATECLQVEAQTLPWPYPLLLKSASPQALARFLQDVVVFEGFAIYGQNLEALEMLPLTDAARLTPECNGLLQLRRIDLLRRSGQIDKATALAFAISQLPSQVPATASLEPRLATQAAFALARIFHAAPRDRRIAAELGGARA